MLLLDVIQVVLLLIVGTLIGYQTFLGLLAFYVRQKTQFDTSYKRKFALVIPAYNEEKMIAKTIYSINGIIYPRSGMELPTIYPHEE